MSNNEPQPQNNFKIIVCVVVGILTIYGVANLWRAHTKNQSDYNEALAWAKIAELGGDWDAADVAYKRALSIKPNDIAVKQLRESGAERHFQDLLSEGKAAEGVDNWEGASAAYQSALKLKPGDSKAENRKNSIINRINPELMSEAKEAEQKKDWDAVTNAYDKVLKIDSQNKNAWYGKGQALEHLMHGTDNVALECFNKALEIDPQFPSALIAKAGYLRGMDAVICYSKALEADPQNDGAWCWKGHELLRIDRIDEAIECYDQALKINPQNAMAWAFKGDALLQHGIKINIILTTECFARVKQCCDRALEIDPENYAAWDTMARTFDVFGTAEEAKACRQKAISLTKPYE